MIEWIYDIGKAQGLLWNLHEEIRKENISKDHMLESIHEILCLISSEKISKIAGEIHFGPGPIEEEF